MHALSWKWTKATSLTLAIATLTACGGSDSKTENESNVGGNTGGTKVSLEEFNLLQQSGTWRFDMDLEGTASSQLTLQGQTVDYVVDYVISGSMPSYIEYNDSTVTVAACDGYPAEVQSTTDFDNSFVFEDADEDGNPIFCPSTLTSNYYIVSDDHYRIELVCDGTTMGNLNLIKLSSTPQFNLGRLSFESDLYDNLNASTGVCGTHMFSDMNTTYTLQDQSQEATYSITNITVEAPYGDSTVLLDMTFPLSITTGSYQVVEDVEDLMEDGYVSVSVMSSVFGGTPEFPDSLYATMGSVTITEHSSTKVTGSFDIDTYNNDTITGNFSFDLNL